MRVCIDCPRLIPAGTRCTASRTTPTSWSRPRQDHNPLDLAARSAFRAHAPARTPMTRLTLGGEAHLRGRAATPL